MHILRDSCGRLAENLEEPICIPEVLSQCLARLSHVREMGLDAVIICKMDTVDPRQMRYPVKAQYEIVFAPQPGSRHGYSMQSPIFLVPCQKFHPGYHSAYDMNIEVNGKILPKEKITNPRSHYRGYFYVQVKKGQAFKVVLRNKRYAQRKARAAVALILDGVDCFYHKTPSIKPR